MIKKSLGNFVIVSLTLLKYKGIVGLLSYLFPIQYHRGQALFMIPYFYNGYFSMRSVNKVKH